LLTKKNVGTETKLNLKNNNAWKQNLIKSEIVLGILKTK